jgi:hypothetical protein
MMLAPPHASFRVARHPGVSEIDSHKTTCLETFGGGEEACQRGRAPCGSPDLTGVLAVSEAGTPFKTPEALHSAASNGSVQILNVLLAPGCDPDAECDHKANCEELGFYIDARGVSDYSISKYVGLGRQAGSALRWPLSPKSCHWRRQRMKAC